MKYGKKQCQLLHQGIRRMRCTRRPTSGDSRSPYTHTRRSLRNGEGRHDGTQRTALSSNASSGVGILVSRLWSILRKLCNVRRRRSSPSEPRGLVGSCGLMRKSWRNCRRGGRYVRSSFALRSHTSADRSQCTTAISRLDRRRRSRSLPFLCDSFPL